MSTLELQEKLIEKIKKSKDDALLEEVMRLIEFEEHVQDIYELNGEQKRLINLSFLEIEQGEFSTDEEVRKETAAWLKK